MNYRIKSKIKNIIIAILAGIMTISIGFQFVLSKARENRDNYPNLKQVKLDIGTDNKKIIDGISCPTLYGNYLIYLVTFKTGLVLDNVYDISMCSYAVYEFGLFSWEWEFKNWGGYVYGYEIKNN